MKIDWRMRSTPHPRVSAVEAACHFGVRSPELIFDRLGLKRGDCFLDAGCGPGEYALLASERVGVQGSVIALDRDPFMLEQLQKKTDRLGIENISVQLAELGTPLALADHRVDSCLLSAVLHMPGLDDRWDVLFSEIHRILRPGGRLGIVESNRSHVAPELPLHLRLTPETVSAGIELHGFQMRELIDLDSSYLALFESV